MIGSIQASTPRTAAIDDAGLSKYAASSTPRTIQRSPEITSREIEALSAPTVAGRLGRTFRPSEA
jgi:hypothetical protein